MRLLSAAVCGLIIASSAYAQTVEVRSGQHDGFIRLTIELPERVDVKIDNWREEAAITLPGQQLRFETSKIFNRISRDRIRDVVAGSGDATLRVKLGCNCEVISFWHGKSLLVLDVRETDTVFPSMSAMAPPVSEDDIQTDPLEFEVNQRSNQRLTIPQGAISLAASLANSQFLPEAEIEADAVETEQPPTPEIPNPEAPLAREVREHFVKQLSRAATQGLISPRSAIAPEPEVEETPAPEEETVITNPPVSSQAAGNINLRAQSSIDRDFLAAITQGMQGHAAPTCIGGNALDVGSWGTDAPFAQQVGALRKGLIGEFDQVNMDTVIQLTRLYLYFGFGVEARQTLSVTEEQPDDSELLSALAAIMEDGYAAPNSALANQLNCDGPETLWAILSYETLPWDTQINKDAALRTFDALPRPLRSHLGPVLSRRFLEVGDQKSADKVLRILNRHEETVTASANLVEAELDRADGESAKAMEGLEAVVETNTEMSAQALIELIDTSIESETAVSFDHAILAGAYLQQNRGGILENELARVYLTGLAASGAFDQSYEERRRLRPSLSPDFRRMVDSEMLNQLTKIGDEITFLRHTLADPSVDFSGINAKISNAAAARLIETGFADAARPFVTQQIEGRLERERKLLRAKISILQGRPRQAESELRNLEGNDASLLRAEARGMVGDHLAAADHYASSGDQERALRQAWLAEDWNRLLQSDESTLSSGAALAMLNGDSSEASEAEGSGLKSDRILSRNRGLIQQSSAARGTIQDILESNPSPALE